MQKKACPHLRKNVFRNLSTNRYSPVITTHQRSKLEDLLDPSGDQLWENGLYARFRLNQVIQDNRLFSFVSEVINAGKTESLLYRIDASQINE